jgi:hypothetical protein
MTKYYLHLDYKDLYIAKFKTKSDDINLIYKEMAENIIMDGFKRGFTIQQQIDKYTSFCDSIYKMKDHCEKIRASDFLMFFSCYFALCKFKCIKPNEYMFLKIKKRKSRFQN